MLIKGLTVFVSCVVVVWCVQQVVMSNSGLLTTVAYQLGPGQPVYYALEVHTHATLRECNPFVETHI